jgi:hypothetical protein
VTVPGPANFAKVLRGSAGRPAALATPRADLIGKSTTELPVSKSGATVSNADDFRAVDPSSGTVPALVYGTVPSSVPAGTLLAVAVNGRVAAVTQVGKADKEGHRFGALITDESVFRTGENQVDVIRLE